MGIPGRLSVNVQRETKKPSKTREKRTRIGITNIMPNVKHQTVMQSLASANVLDLGLEVPIF